MELSTICQFILHDVLYEQKNRLYDQIKFLIAKIQVQKRLFLEFSNFTSLTGQSKIKDSCKSVSGSPLKIFEKELSLLIFYHLLTNKLSHARKQKWL